MRHAFERDSYCRMCGLELAGCSLSSEPRLLFRRAVLGATRNNVGTRTQKVRSLLDCVEASLGRTAGNHQGSLRRPSQ